MRLRKKAKQPVTTAARKHVLLALSSGHSFIHHCRPPCKHAIQIDEDNERAARVVERESHHSWLGLPVLCCSPVFLPACSHQQPTWWMSMLSAAIRTQSRPFFLTEFYFLSVFPLSLCLSDWLSLFLCLPVSFSLSVKALLYPFYSLSVTLKANSQSQWV